MKPLVTRPDGTKKIVANLGWMLRHWKEVESFKVEKGKFNGYEAHLMMSLKDGTTYETPYASRAILLHFLHRPVFMSLQGTWFGHALTISDHGSVTWSVLGSPEHKDDDFAPMNIYVVHHKIGAKSSLGWYVMTAPIGSLYESAGGPYRFRKTALIEADRIHYEIEEPHAESKSSPNT